MTSTEIFKQCNIMIVAVLVCEKLIPNVAELLQGAAPAPPIENLTKLVNNIKSKSFSTEL